MESFGDDLPDRMPTLSKSKLIAFKQCQKRLWLAVKKPSLKDESGSGWAPVN